MSRKARKKRVEPDPNVRVIVVDDPGELLAGGRVYPEPGQKTKAVQSLRDDPLGRMHCRGYIDDAQYRAGLHMQGLYERSQIGPLKAMDTTKEPVDGGGMAPEAFTDAMRKAILRIQEVELALGREGAALVRAVLAGRLFLNQLAKDSTERENRYIARRFRECLETMAKELGYA